MQNQTNPDYIEDEYFYPNGKIQFKRIVNEDDSWEETHFDEAGDFIYSVDHTGYWEKRCMMILQILQEIHLGGYKMNL